MRLLRSRLGEDYRAPLGEAQVDTQARTGSIATVFADRVASTSNRAGANARGVLGRVIAHEIGHLLIGTNHHSARGLMRAIWTDLELRRSIGLEWRSPHPRRGACAQGSPGDHSARANPELTDGECDATRRHSSPAKSWQAQ